MIRRNAACGAALAALLLGAPTEAATPAGIDPRPTVVVGEGERSEFGFAVAGAGDVDGDGFDDVLVGAPAYLEGPNGVAHGRAYLYRGGERGLSGSPATLITGGRGAGLGTVVAGAGDLDGDGFDDVAVAAPMGGSLGIHRGSATGLRSEADQILELETHSLSAADVDGDGLSDLVVGAAGPPEVVRLYKGSSGDLALTGQWEEPEAEYGLVTLGAGDLDGDGYQEVVTANPYGSGAVGSGASPDDAVKIFYGSADGTRFDAPVPLPGEAELFGYALADAGDVDADGFDDLAVGAPGNGFREDGRVFLVYGAAGALEDREVLRAEPQSFGSDVAGVGDLDGDGFADLAVGAWGATADELRESGKVYVYLGGLQGIARSPVITVDGEEQEDYFGSAIAGAGDVNGDGLDDLVVGAHAYGCKGRPYFLRSPWDGRAYVYFGSSGEAEGCATAAGRGPWPLMLLMLLWRRRP